MTPLSGAGRKGKKIYKFPEWVTEDMKENFFSMWAVFNRTPKDYQEAQKSSNAPSNGSIQTMEKLSIRPTFVTGEFFYKWNNIGWIYDGKEVHHVMVSSRRANP